MKLMPVSQIVGVDISLSNAEAKQIYDELASLEGLVKKDSIMWHLHEEIFRLYNPPSEVKNAGSTG